MGLIVQRQGVVTQAPGIADPLGPVDDQGIDAKLAQTGGDTKARLGAANHQNVRLMPGVGLCRVPQVEPIVAAEFPGITFPVRSVGANAFFMAGDLFQGRRQHPGAPIVSIPFFTVQDQAEDTIGRSRRGLEGKNSLDGLGPGPGYQARRRAVGGDLKPLGLGAGLGLPQPGRDIVPAVHGPDMPGEGDQVTPVPIA